MQEIWKDIEGFEGLYQVSNDGRVRSKDRCRGSRIYKGQLLKQTVDKKGYMQINLSNPNLPAKHQTAKVHRLVAKAFIENPNNLPQVNHIDEDKKNNSVANLEWCDNKYNSNYGTRVKRVALKHCKKVFQYSKSGDLVKIHDSVYLAAVYIGGCYSSLQQCLTGRRKTAHGFIWKYYEVENERI